MPYYLPPIGEDLRLTIVSTDDNDPADNNAGAGKNDQAAGANETADEHPLD